MREGEGPYNTGTGREGRVESSISHALRLQRAVSDHTRTKRTKQRTHTRWEGVRVPVLVLYDAAPRELGRGERGRHATRLRGRTWTWTFVGMGRAVMQNEWHGVT